MILPYCKSIKWKFRDLCICGNSDAHLRVDPTPLVIGEASSERITDKATRTKIDRICQSGRKYDPVFSGEQGYL